VVDIINIRPSADETFDSVSTQLIEYETSNALGQAQIRSNPNTAGTVAEGHALAVEGGTRETHIRQQSGQGRANGRANGKGHSNRCKPYGSKPVSKCFYFLNEGHRQNECTLKQNAEAFRKETLDGWRTQKSQIYGSFAVTDDTDIGDNSTEMHAYSATSEKGLLDSWLIDLEASRHLAGNKKVLRDIRSPFEPIPVNVPNGTNCLETGSGSILSIAAKRANTIPDPFKIENVDADENAGQYRC